MALTAPGKFGRLPLVQSCQISRTFLTSHPVGSSRVPPESPYYVRLPTPPQSDEIKPIRVRGHLPVPREVFPRLEGDRKVRADYIEKTAPSSTKPREGNSTAQIWKTAMAESRRNNLKDGLDALWSRRLNLENSRNIRVSRKFREHNKARSAAERDDDRLTRPTILESMLDTTVYPDPSRFFRANRSRTKVMAREDSNREARRDSLMELYISASNFIVEEADLKIEIDKVFAEDCFRQKSQNDFHHSITENTWGMHGKPPSVANMMETSTGVSTKVMDVHESEHDRSAKRQKRIAEDLTGGKMV
ncbi:uncharacterized protein UV8b_07918 [Ustilaginoidea virens]|uniref:Uncharacterized protein n=1 Tax=Ustilaginoidea virens TaxID=1159556 RepID=A0A063C5I0_USTVR|nr:uncharacterized protein UV8b_07918 [Ustilaginoidea virens]QUC23677.1 hypothetical protein UV8b_07918 [Ustilaginoidea virens]GAO16722.1 hypothetical protein UVI_02002680 [Ustilaginoidea virens]